MSGDNDDWADFGSSTETGASDASWADFGATTAISITKTQLDSANGEIKFEDALQEPAKAEKNNGSIETSFTPAKVRFLMSSPCYHRF